VRRLHPPEKRNPFLGRKKSWPDRTDILIDSPPRRKAAKFWPKMAFLGWSKGVKTGEKIIPFDKRGEEGRSTLIHETEDDGQPGVEKGEEDKGRRVRAEQGSLLLAAHPRAQQGFPLMRDE